MDLFEAITGRRSCRKFQPEAVSDADIETILEAGNWAPSPANQQPWEISSSSRARRQGEDFRRERGLQEEALRAQRLEVAGEIPHRLRQGDPGHYRGRGRPEKSGADMFLDEGTGRGYLEGCSAAVQNMMLAAHALGLGSLWFSLYESAAVRQILGLDPDKDPVALLCIGKPASAAASKRKDFREKTTYLR